jgi:hypothetical protein
MPDSNNEVDPYSDLPSWDEDLPRVLDAKGTPAEIDYRQMRICGQCFSVEGQCRHKGQWLDQAHTHDRQSRISDPAESPLWDGFDFNEVVCLCYCCGTELLESGSKWSVWFCPECNKLAVHVNRFLQYYWLPIGRHSAMSSSSETPLGLIHGQDIQRPKKVESFVEDLQTVFQRVERIRLLAKEAVRQNFLCLGFKRENAISLPSYIRTVKATQIDKKVRFIQLCQRMGLPWLEVHTLGYQETVETHPLKRK